jgi:hypothetical protein
MRSNHPTAPLAAALALVVLGGATGCYHLVTEEVRVRDPDRVSVERADGTISLPAGVPGTAIQDEGVFGRPFVPTSYRVLAERDRAGNIALHCDGCEDAWWANGHGTTLLTSDGALRPVTTVSLLSSSASAVTLGAEELDLQVPACLLASRRCEVHVEALLSTPRENVIDIRRRESPHRPMGSLLLGISAAPIAVGALLAAGKIVRLGPGERALVATPLLTVGAAFSAAGIWHLTAPVEETLTVIQPPAAME